MYGLWLVLRSIPGSLSDFSMRANRKSPPPRLPLSLSPVPSRSLRRFLEKFSLSRLLCRLSLEPMVVFFAFFLCECVCVCCSFKRISARGQTHDQLGFPAPCCSSAAHDVPPQSHRRPPSHSAVTRCCFGFSPPLLLFLLLCLFLLLGLRAPGWDDEDAPAAASSSSRPSVRAPLRCCLGLCNVERPTNRCIWCLLRASPCLPLLRAKKKKKMSVLF